MVSCAISSRFRCKLYIIDQLVVEFGPPSLGIRMVSALEGATDIGIISECPGTQINVEPSIVKITSASDDSTIALQNQDQMLGSNDYLEVSACSDRDTVIRFDIADIVGSMSIEYAAVLVYIADASILSGATFIQTIDTDWGEDFVNWGNSPEGDGMVLGSLSSNELVGWFEVDVTAAIASSSTDYLSIRVVPLSAAAASCNDLSLTFMSKEHTSGHGPHLVIVPTDGMTILTPPVTATTSEKELGNEYFDCSVGKPPSEKVVVTPMDDSFIFQNRIDSNYGRDSQLLVDGNPVINALMKFDISCVDVELLTSAVLRVFSVDGSPSGGKFFVISGKEYSDWSEETVTWKSAPSGDSIFLSELDRVVNNTWYDIDITSAINGKYQATRKKIHVYFSFVS